MSREVVLPPSRVLLPPLGPTGRRRGSGGQWRGSSGPAGGTCLGLEGDQEQRIILSQSPGFCKQCCSASVGIPKAWSGTVTANAIYGAVVMAG